jgi:tetratricopeptide (TPR) repeat protein
MKTARKQLVVFAFLALAASALAATPAPLQPAAQEALNKGIIAAKVPDYLLAIRYFEEARKLAPQAPVIYLNLGLAESKIPGRELRAMAWFGAYLAAYPDAPNAAAVKEQIAVLDVKSQSNISRFLKTLQDTASANYDKDLIGGDQMFYFSKIAVLWVKAGDVSAALRTADLYSPINKSNKRDAWMNIARTQAEAGDSRGALKTADLIQDQDAFYKSWAQRSIAEVQIKNGDRAGAQKTLVLAVKMTDLFDNPESYGADNKSRSLKEIALAQIEAGDRAGAKTTLASALRTAGFIKEAKARSDAQTAIAAAQIKTGDMAGAKAALASALKSADLIQEPSNKAIAQAAIALAQTEAGDMTGARATLAAAQNSVDLVKEEKYKSIPQHRIVEALAKLGDTEDAQKIAEHVQNIDYKRDALRLIANAKAKAKEKAGMTSAVNSTSPSASDTHAKNRPVLTVSVWLKKLDDGDKRNECALNTGPFLDLAGYLKSLPSSDDPPGVFKSLHETAEKIVNAQNVIAGMLKQQAKP